MPRYLKKIWAGDVYEAKEYNSPRQKGKGCERAMRENISPEKIAEYNFLETRKKCGRMINANFKAGDIFLTLTYRKQVGIEDALRLFRNFIGRLKRLRKRKGLDALKYIYVIETGKKGREHLHMIINDMDVTLKELTELWGLGRVMISRLEPGGDYTGLAFYIQGIRTQMEREPQFRKAEGNGDRGCEKPKAAGAEKLQGGRGDQLLQRYDGIYQIHEGNTDWRRGLWRREATRTVF